MSELAKLPVDLSDLDPYSPTPSPQPGPSPLFAPTPSTTSTQATQPLPPPAVNVQTRAISPGQDPLAATLGRIHLGSSSSSSSPSRETAQSQSEDGPVSTGNTESKLVQAQHERNHRILTDLAREPFAPTPPPPLTSEPSQLSEEPGALPDLLPSLPTDNDPRPHHAATLPRRRSSRSGSSGPAASSHHHHQHHPSSPSTTGGGFSPPRRLSSLMDLHAPFSTSHALSSPPAETSALADPFHPVVHRRDGDPDATRRIREASRDSWPSFPQETSGSSDWGDFQTHVTPALSTSPPASPTRASRIPGSPPPPPPSPPRSPPDNHGPSSSLLGSSFRAATLPLPAPLQSALNSHSFSSFFSLNPATLERKASSPPPPLPPHPPAPVTRATAPPGAVKPNGFDPTAQPVRLTGVRPGVARALDEDIAEGIRPFLPPRLRLSSKWNLLYSLDQHGISVHTLFANLDRGLRDRDGGFVLVVKSERDEIFGAYCSEALKDASATRGPAQRWAGDGSCFLWKSTPFSPTDFRIGSSVRAFKPTFRNTYYQHASPEFLAFGGGEDGVFGLWIDGVFERGWTGRCETYANEPLVDLCARGLADEAGDATAAGADRDGRRSLSSKAQEEGKFEVVGFECWAVG
ncbi:hypothetical protein JCM3774_005907 [Rhodotorula dairenensis]